MADPQGASGSEPITLTEILDGKPIPFKVGSKAFFIRQPDGAEYDDAQHLYAVAYARAMAEPDVKALKAEPCSDPERAMYEALAAVLETQAGLLSDEAGVERQAKLEEAKRLRETAAKRTAAEELAHDRALTVKERWLCCRLLCDADGNPLFDTGNPADMAKWRKLSLRVKDAARPAIRRALALAVEAPFE